MTWASDREDSLGRALHAAAAGLAVLGGIVLFAITVASVVSIAGRVLFSAPIPGDFELVEIGTAVAVFAFLPYCQIVRGNVVVDFFTHRARPRTRAGLDALGNLIFTAIAALLTWRLAVGAAEIRGYGETSMVLGVPVWLGYVPATVSLAFLTLVCAYTVARSVREFREAEG